MGEVDQSARSRVIHVNFRNHYTASKPCERCGGPITRRTQSEKPKQLEARRFCSRACFIEPPLERLEKYIFREPNSGCWLWTGTYEHEEDWKQGRALTTYKNKNWYASRLMWFLTFGEIPQGLYVLHKCDCPGCVNPDHLYLGTHGRNTADALARNRFPRIVKPKDIPAIVERRRNGETFKAIAKDYGCSGITISRHIKAAATSELEAAGNGMGLR